MPRKPKQVNKASPVAFVNNDKPVGNRAKCLANLKPFKPGQSGNPNGRPKENKDVKRKARDGALEALETLMEVMRDKEATPSARVAAATAVLDRGFGKPLQQIEQGGPGDFSDMSDEELDQFILDKASEFVHGYSRPH